MPSPVAAGRGLIFAAMILVATEPSRGNTLLLSPGVLVYNGGSFGRLTAGPGSGQVVTCDVLPCTGALMPDFGVFQTNTFLNITVGGSPGELDFTETSFADAKQIAQCGCTQGIGDSAGIGIFIYLAATPGTTGTVTGIANAGFSLTGFGPGTAQPQDFACAGSICASDGQTAQGIYPITIGQSPDFVVNGTGYYFVTSLTSGVESGVGPPGPDAPTEDFASTSASVAITLSGGIPFPPLTTPEPSTFILLGPVIPAVLFLGLRGRNLLKLSRDVRR